MGLFWPSVMARIRRDGARLRGSTRTARLRKKRLKHLEELYVRYRDEIFLARMGVTFADWKRRRGRKGA